MVYELIHEVSINNVLYKVINVEIEKSISSLTNNCIITVPKRLQKDGEDIFSDIDSFLIKKEDIVKVKLGYRQGYQMYFDKYQFEGFVSEIKLNENTVEIICEDYMYFLKKTKFNFSAQNITLKELGKKIADEVNTKLPVGVKKIEIDTNSIDLKMTNLKFEKATGAQVLEHLKTYTLDCFFTGNKLSIGVNYQSTADNANEANTHTFSMFPRDLIKTVSDKNFLFIIDKSGLNYQKEEDLKIKITAKVFTKNDEFYEKSFGDEDGEERTFIFSGNPSKSELEKLVENQLKRIKYEGFQTGSSFTTFGKPDIQPLDVVSFDGLGFVRWYNGQQKNSSKINLYKKSSYLVDNVKTTFGNGGFRQIIGIAQKLTIEEGESISEKLGKTMDI